MEDSGFPFSRSTKDAAFRQAVQAGDITPDTTDLHFHHIVPQEVAKKEGLPPPLVSSVENCLPLKAEDHRRLHQQFKPEELANQQTELLEKMRNNKKGLFG